MKDVKKFQFPTFEEWCERKHEWSQKIGGYTCRVAIDGWGVNGNTKDDYEIGISKSDNPLNIYSRRLFHDGITCDRKDSDSLRLWYENAIQKANETWEAYIINNYLE